MLINAHWPFLNEMNTNKYERKTNMKKLSLFISISVLIFFALYVYVQAQNLIPYKNNINESKKEYTYCVDVVWLFNLITFHLQTGLDASVLAMMSANPNNY